MQSVSRRMIPFHNKKQPPKDLDAKKMLASLKRELEYLHRDFDTATDPTMIDSLTYQIMSVNMKYKFFLNMCRGESPKELTSVEGAHKISQSLD